MPQPTTVKKMPSNHDGERIFEDADYRIMQTNLMNLSPKPACRKTCRRKGHEIERNALIASTLSPSI